MKKIVTRLIMLILVMIGLIYGYYWVMQKQAEKAKFQTTGLPSLLQSVDSNELLSLRGFISMNEGHYYLRLEDSELVPLSSDALMLSAFLEKKVEVKGHLVSGQLAVTKIDEID